MKGEHNHLILDSYNANPSSMREAIKGLMSYAKPPTMLILGDMAELLKLVWDTIDVCYRPVYSDEAITHWEDEHNEPEILKDASEGIIIIAELDGKMVGTGTLSNDLKRWF